MVTNILKKNISSLNYEKEAIVIEKDILKTLDYKNFKEKFDIIFMDPPYKEKSLNLMLLQILNSKILNNEDHYNRRCGIHRITHSN